MPDGNEYDDFERRLNARLSDEVDDVRGRRGMADAARGRARRRRTRSTTAVAAA